jgi:hypothetical protein
MPYSLRWLPIVLEEAGLTVIQYPGWQTRGHGDVGPIQFVMCHHSAAKRGSGNAPSLELVAMGRPDLPGPLSQLVLARNGIYYVVAAGKGYHAGTGEWMRVTAGNAYSIGIEAENDGIGEPWPVPQMEAYIRGVAAILRHIKAEPIMAVGHREFALPKGRKIDPNFSMNEFRWRVEQVMK